MSNVLLIFDLQSKKAQDLSQALKSCDITMGNLIRYAKNNVFTRFLAYIWPISSI
nr:MAG TPA: hypothetical protein [Caudoviricetes sp.]